MRDKEASSATWAPFGRSLDYIERIMREARGSMN